MQNENDRINELNERLKFLAMRQADLSAALEKLQQEIAVLKTEPANENAGEKEIVTEPIVPLTVGEPKPEIATPYFETPIQRIPKRTSPTPAERATKTSQSSSALEKFIGENLINKIGILISKIVFTYIEYFIFHFIRNSCVL